MDMEEKKQDRGYTGPTRGSSTANCIHTYDGWQVTLRDPTRHVSFP